MTFKYVVEKIENIFIPRQVLCAFLLLSLLGSVYPVPWSPDAVLPDEEKIVEDEFGQVQPEAPPIEQNPSQEPLQKDYLSENDIEYYPDSNESSSSDGRDVFKPNIDGWSELSVIRSNPKAGKRVALTFDDGPYDVWSQRYMDILESYGVKATFFLVGSRAEKFSDIVVDMAQRGFGIGGHSYAHSNIKNKSIDKIQEDFEMTLDVIESITGQDVRFFRPPYGAYNDKLLKTAYEFNQITVTWNVDPRDWAGGRAEEISRKVLDNVSDGSIVLLHEGKENTWGALPAIIEGLMERGYEIVSLSELLSLEDEGSNPV